MGNLAESKRRMGLGHRAVLQGKRGTKAQWLCGEESPVAHTWGKSEQLLQKCSSSFFLLQNGRKRNNGGRGKGGERRTPTHKPKLIFGVYCEITAKILRAP